MGRNQNHAGRNWLTGLPLFFLLGFLFLLNGPLVYLFAEAMKSTRMLVVSVLVEILLVGFLIGFYFINRFNGSRFLAMQLGIFWWLMHFFSIIVLTESLIPPIFIAVILVIGGDFLAARRMPAQARKVNIFLKVVPLFGMLALIAAEIRWQLYSMTESPYVVLSWVWEFVDRHYYNYANVGLMLATMVTYIFLLAGARQASKKNRWMFSFLTVRILGFAVFISYMDVVGAIFAASWLILLLPIKKKWIKWFSASSLGDEEIAKSSE
ncbi:MAG TPA: hypothetical protein PKW95_05385 [bacterium]|nr:hypothetical protein [bacterium]